MAKYLDTHNISSELMNLIKEAKEKIVLVTYSLKVNTQIQERLKTKSSYGNITTRIIFGNTKLKPSEIEWMRGIDDLKLFQKKNLHAKCYLNENKAIISSMNLYDYSQYNNIEMGILIERKENEDAWEKLMEDIANLQINGEPIKLDALFTLLEKEQQENVEKKQEDIQTINVKYNYQQQLAKILIENFRKIKSKELKQNVSQIISDEIIEKIVQAKNILEVKEILENEDKTKLIREITKLFEKCNGYSFGKVIDVKYSKDGFSYDKICLLSFDNGTEKWYDTKKELPKKDDCVAVKLNGEWFNDYEVLSETSIPFSRVNYTEKENKNNKESKGYCIRCGDPIEFNVERPLCKSCFSVWSQFGDETYQEEFCHFSGEPSDGETSFAKPILKKNWAAAKEKMK